MCELEEYWCSRNLDDHLTQLEVEFVQADTVEVSMETHEESEEPYDMRN